MAQSFPNARVHPIYRRWEPIWRKLADCYEGTGGFLDGGYLIPHPREWEDHTSDNPQKPTAKLLERRRLARYENLAAKIVNAKTAALFRTEPHRQVQGGGAHPWLDWCTNVDGAGASMTTYMRHTWRQAAILGHCAILMDRPRTEPPPVVRSDVPAPFLRTYAALDLLDWLADAAGRLTAVVLSEGAHRTSFEEQYAAKLRTRTVTATTWRIGIDGVAALGPGQQGEHNIGRLPVVLLHGSPRSLIQVVGQSLLYDPALYIDLYNLTSEIRELLRKQTFGLLNIPLGVGDQAVSVQQAQDQAGTRSGTGAALFTAHPANYLSPAAENVTVYQAERAELVRTIFRLTDIPWESDSKDAEAEGSLKLKREDLNQILGSYADACTAAEMEIAELWFRAEYADRWKDEWDRAQPLVRYSKSFDPTPFVELLDEAQAAVALPLGRSKRFMNELCTRLVGQFLPDAAPEIIAAIQTELENLPTEREEREMAVRGMLARFGESQRDAEGDAIQ